MNARDPQRPVRLQTTRTTVLCALWWLMIVPVCPVLGEIESLAKEAENHFLKGLEQLENDPGEARAALARAAGMYELLASHPQARQAPARGNAGNAWLLAGDSGRAILNYRRALLLQPGDRVARNGLGEARVRSATQVTGGVQPGSIQHIRDRLAIEHRSSLWTAFLVANACFWIAASLFLRSRSHRRRRLTWAGVIASLMLLILLFWSHGARSGVVTAAEVIGRQGNGPVYQAAWRSPLSNGVEFSLIEQRGEWWRIRLADGTQGWIPVQSAVLVRPP